VEYSFLALASGCLDAHNSSAIDRTTNITAVDTAHQLSFEKAIDSAVNPANELSFEKAINPAVHTAFEFSLQSSVSATICAALIKSISSAHS
jgi:hypothetical protein